jgi:glyoxylase-like metal-dependent hydrolase (beta-lactamase superfamily II)
MSCSYVLLSSTGEALVIDYGYDMTTGLAYGSDRAAKRPWLASLPALRQRYGVTAITAALATHYHDDHVAGLPLLRSVAGAELWVPENVAPVLGDPWRYDLPCQWYEPIVADRVLPLGEPIRWNEYEIVVHPLPGHTRFAAAFQIVVDGVTVLFTGDQQTGLGVPGEIREFLNYQYRNWFTLGDFVRSAELYRRIAPGLMATGHWEPRAVDEAYLAMVAEEGRFVDDVHRALLPLDEVDLGADGVAARIVPFRSRVEPEGTVRLSIVVRNPFRVPTAAELEVLAPDGWRVEPQHLTGDLVVGEDTEFGVEVTPPAVEVRRGRVVVDVTIGELRLGQHTEAIVHVGRTDVR